MSYQETAEQAAVYAQRIMDLEARNAELVALARAIVKLESSPLQLDYVPPTIQALARAALAKGA